MHMSFSATFCHLTATDFDMSFIALPARKLHANIDKETRLAFASDSHTPVDAVVVGALLVVVLVLVGVPATVGEAVVPAVCVVPMDPVLVAVPAVLVPEFAVVSCPFWLVGLAVSWPLLFMPIAVSPVGALPDFMVSPVGIAPIAPAATLAAQTHILCQR